jgi:hypothetical protein
MNSTVFHPECDPSTAPRLKRNRRTRCACDLPTCRYCRQAAKQRRWYRKNRRSSEGTVKLEPLKRWQPELDEKALKWLEERGMV